MLDERIGVLLEDGPITIESGHHRRMTKHYVRDTLPDLCFADLHSARTIHEDEAATWI